MSHDIDPALIAQMASFGGRPLTEADGVKSSGGPTWYFGWDGNGLATPEQERANRSIADAMPRFEITGRNRSTANMVGLWEGSLKVNNGRHFNTFRQVSGSCFPAGAPVRLATGGEKAIEHVEIGDAVITHMGRSRRVVETMRRAFTGELITVHVGGFPFPLEMTEDHQVAVLAGRCDWRWQPGEIIWKRADELDIEDRVLIGWDRRDSLPSSTMDVAGLLGEQAMILDDLMERSEAPVARIQVAQHQCRKSGIDWHGRVKVVRSRNENAVLRHVPIGPSLARLLGLYLAEGGCHQGRVVFSFDAKEEDLAGEVLALVRGLFGVEGEMVRQKKRPTVLKVRFNNTTLATAFKRLMPGDVYTKRVPDLFFTCSKETKLALILGWMAGDGYAAIKTGKKPSARIQGVTVSADLARDMTTLALSCGLRATCSKRKARKQSRAAYDVYLTGKKAVSLFPALATFAESAPRLSDSDSARTEHGYARRVRGIDRRTVEMLPVYDFEVEEDHSFLAGGLTVHNCVGNGGGQATRYVAACDQAIRGEAEEGLELMFWLLAYGKSREIMGARGRGEGSLGGAMAEAVKLVGFPSQKVSGLPVPDESDGLSWGKSVEIAWSYYPSQPRGDWDAEGKKHPIQTTAKMRSSDDVREAIRNYYACTCASMWGGQMRPSVTDGVLLNTHSDSWSHQMSIIGWQDHPSLGELFYILNSWGPQTHGTCPTGAPPGGFWVRKKDVDFMCADEVYAFSQWQGFPAQEINWYI